LEPCLSLVPLVLIWINTAISRMLVMVTSFYNAFDLELALIDHADKHSTSRGETGLTRIPA